VARQDFEDRIRVHLLDYQEMPLEWDGSFDRVVSIEMVEAVGLENVDMYWGGIDHILKRKNAAGVIQGKPVGPLTPSSPSHLHDHVPRHCAHLGHGHN
jgi:hypothetical protein